jgi:putative redox protein
MVHGLERTKGKLLAALTSDGFRVVRFDLSGYGKSEGRQEEASYSKHVEDLRTVIEYVKSNFSEPVYLFAQSMGCFIAALTSPSGIEKTIMTGLPNANPKLIIDRVINRFGTRHGAALDMDRISLLPRSTGKVQKIGPQFWKDIRDLDPIKAITDYSKKTELLVVHWENDEIIGKEFLDEYDAIPTVKALWLPGDHSVTIPQNRNNFIKIMLEFYN